MRAGTRPRYGGHCSCRRSVACTPCRLRRTDRRFGGGRQPQWKPRVEGCAQRAVASVPLPVGRTSARLADYLALTKPRLNLLVVATSAAGYYLGATRRRGHVGDGAGRRGHRARRGRRGRPESGVRARHRRADAPHASAPAAGRPRAAGRRPHFGLALALAGLALLAARANLLAALLAVATLIIYLARLHADEAPIVAFDARRRGAGRAAAADRVDRFARLLSRGGVALFAIVFLWQIPHFMAIAWMYRDDYAKAGFPMLPVIEPKGRRAGRQAVLYAAALRAGEPRARRPSA